MLHKINIPELNRFALKWIMLLQTGLITGLCKPEVTGLLVNPEWLYERVIHLGVDRTWFSRFCNWQIEGEHYTFLELAQTIANYSPEIKNQILNGFKNNRHIEQSFESGTTPPHNLSQVRDFPDGLAKEVGKFFKQFYDPALYRNYKILYNGHTLDFDHHRLVTEFKDSNCEIHVCPFCDGNPESTEIDHFYPKAHYPYLACHPLNLTPICGACNGPEGKGQVDPLDLDAFWQSADWFHPYLRPAYASEYRITFERQKEGLTPALKSDDPQTQRRLDNLMCWLKLCPRWRGALKAEVNAVQRYIHREKEKLGASSLNKDQLCAKLKDWAESAEDDIGLMPNSILKQAYLTQAMQQVPMLFDELWIFNNPEAEESQLKPPVVMPTEVPLERGDP